MRKLVLTLSLAAAIVSSCQKGDKGDPGPQGPVGPAGPQGHPGTANVIYSDWFQFEKGDWNDTIMTNFNNATRAIKDVSIITDDVLDKGVVIAYLRTEDGSGPYQLPFTWNKNPARNIAIIPAKGKIIFYNYAFDDSGGSMLSPNHKYRYVIIPGGVPAAQNGSGGTITYNELCEKYKIPE